MDKPFTRNLLARLSKELSAEVSVEELGEEAKRPTSKQVLFIENEPGEFIKPCPCTPGAVRCGYWVLSLGFQCPYACSYCFLRFYAPDEPLTLYANLEDAAEQFHRAAAQWPSDKPVRVGTGEFTDSLALEPWTAHAAWLAELVRPYPHVQLELKTKSANIASLLEMEPLPNMVIAWTLSPEGRVTSDEPGTATLAQRLDAAARAVEHGYRVAFHFDPIIINPKTSEIDPIAPYLEVVDQLFKRLPSQQIAWISLGTLRFPRRFMDDWGPRLRGNPIYFDEFVSGEDGKLRYFWPIRKNAYEKIAARIDKYSGDNAPVYLCMESQKMWGAGLGWSPDEEEVERLLCKPPPGAV
jgi:spore photoproduct lyase